MMHDDSSVDLFRDGHELYGDAFDAYANLHRPELRAEGLAAFESSYLGTFTSQEELVAAVVEQSGLLQPLRELVHRYDAYSGPFGWFKNAIIAALDTTSELVVIGDSIHVFKR